VGLHAFVGGYTVATKDVLPYSRTVGNRARIYGLNGVGLARRGFSREVVTALRRAYRVLLQGRLNTSEAVARIEADAGGVPELRVLVDFIRTSRRGVVLKRRRRPDATDDAQET
jgi:UDP-N-acetylglucosamine acyltransferase